MIKQSTLLRLSSEIGTQLTKNGGILGLAESCTGGLAASMISEIAGCSAWFDSSYVVYSNQAKHDMLQVSIQDIQQYGAVSEQVAYAMVQGVLKQRRCNIAASVTGIAGPSGGTPNKPVGTVCFAWASLDGPVITQTYHFQGTRQSIRMQSVETLLRGIMQLPAYHQSTFVE